MATTFTDYTAPATYTITFPYIDVSNVKVSVDGVAKTQPTHYTVVGSAVVFTAGNTPANGAVIRVRRETYRAAPLVDFNNGSTLIASDLDTALTQTLYINQEVAELNDTTLAIEAGTDNYTALNKKITTVATPTNAQDATNKTYVDTADALKVSKAGDSMSGNLSMGSNRITNLASPSNNTDAANRTYVDTTVSNIGAYGYSTPPQRWAFTATAGQVDFVITGATASSATNYLVYANGVAKDPTVDFNFTAGTSTITFTTAPGSGVKVLVLAIGYKVPTEVQLAQNPSVTSLIVSGTTQTGGLLVTGSAANFQGGISMNTGISAGSISSASTVAAATNLSAGGTLNVSGAATLNGGVTSTTIQGSTSLTSLGTLSVTGTSQLTGNVTATNSIVTDSAALTKNSGVGYRSVNWPGIVTQTTNRNTGVTLNGWAGQIQIFSATPVLNSYNTFLFTNSVITDRDTVVIRQKATSTNVYNILVGNIGNGSCIVSFASVIGTTADAPIFNFTVLKNSIS